MSIMYLGLCARVFFFLLFCPSAQLRNESETILLLLPQQPFRRASRKHFWDGLLTVAPPCRLLSVITAQ
jgi:hypothetical protein